MKLQKRQLWLDTCKLVGFGIPLDGLMSTLKNDTEIDIIKFDELLLSKYADYDEDKFSMAQFILYKFGNRVFKNVMKLMK